MKRILIPFPNWLDFGSHGQSDQLSKTCQFQLDRQARSLDGQRVVESGAHSGESLKGMAGGE